jgi:hypothetical protein
MKDNIKLFLDWILPIMCLINMIAFWGDASLVAAWVVAFAGWSSNLINRYKNA